MAPSTLHEALVMLVRNRPGLVGDLLAAVLGQTPVAGCEARVEEASLGQVRPIEHRADLVVVLRDGQRPALGVVVEVQLHRDNDKPWVWPVYAVTLRERLRAPTCVLVIAPDGDVAGWASRPCDLGPSMPRFQPLVLGPEQVPVVTEPEMVRRSPELAVLSAIAHGGGGHGLEIALALGEASDVLDSPGQALYIDIAYAALGPAARAALEAMMRDYKWEPQSPFAKEFYAMKDQLLAEMERRTREAAQNAKVESLLTVLVTRGLEPTPSQRARIAQCDDLERLDLWIKRAVTAAGVGEVLD